MVPQETPATNDLRGHWEYFKDRIANSPRVCVLSDFDGTLVELEARPDLPQLTGPGRDVLERLLRTGRAAVGIVSGRSLGDLVGRIGLTGIWYVGNHGYELRDPQGREQRLYEQEQVRYLEEVGGKLRGALGEIPGLLLENKGPILAVHFRNVASEDIGAVERGFFKEMERHRHLLMVSRGHHVLEARLRSGANKGRAVSRIRHDLPAGTLVLYFGDDLTDRDAFRELKGVGVSVEVGGGDSSLADFTLPNPHAVLTALSEIASQLELPHSSASRFRRSPSQNNKE